MSATFRARLGNFELFSPQKLVPGCNRYQIEGGKDSIFGAVFQALGILGTVGWYLETSGGDGGGHCQSV